MTLMASKQEQARDTFNSVVEYCWVSTFEHVSHEGGGEFKKQLLLRNQTIGLAGTHVIAFLKNLASDMGVPVTHREGDPFLNAITTVLQPVLDEHNLGLKWINIYHLFEIHAFIHFYPKD